MTPAEAALIVAAAAGHDTLPDGWHIKAYVRGRDATIAEHELNLGSEVIYGILAFKDDEEVIAIRGTKGIIEWLEDLRAIPVRAQVGHVHQGFRDVYNTLTIDGEPLAKALQGHGDLTIAGHSLGAALATLAVEQVPDAKGIFIASPKVGDSCYRDWFKSRFPFQSFANLYDLVPKLPLWGFSQLPHTTLFGEFSLNLANNHSILNYARWLDGK